MLPLLIVTSAAVASFLCPPAVGLATAVAFASFALICLFGESKNHTREQRAGAILTFALLSLICFLGYLVSSNRVLTEPAGVEITSEVQSLG